ncbi:Uncharacterised protein [uncultured archaeon]|nr:Uncharacterised protein [uncultured archaeon]
MPTIDKALAEAEIERVKKQKKPKVYCIVRYQNRLNGDSEKGIYSDYSICYNLRDYEALVKSDFVGGIDILWSSEKFKQDKKIENDENCSYLENLLGK